MASKIYGYLRVSSMDQNDERQRRELLSWGVLPRNLYSDKVSGKNFNRTEYQKMRQKIKEGDLVVVKSIDRLGRNYDEILNEWRYLVQEQKADIVILDMPILDTRNKKDLIGTLISDIVLQLLSYVAQSEREFIRQRQAEGIALAKANGVHFGRVAEPYPDDFDRIYDLWQRKVLTLPEAAKKLDITVNQLKWLVSRRRREEK